MNRALIDLAALAVIAASVVYMAGEYQRSQDRAEMALKARCEARWSIAEDKVQFCDDDQSIRYWGGQ